MDLELAQPSAPQRHRTAAASYLPEKPVGLAMQVFWGACYIEVPWWTTRGGLQVPVDYVCVPHRRFVYDYLTFKPHLTSEKNPWPGTPLQTTPGSSWIRAESTRWRKQTQAGT